MGHSIGLFDRLHQLIEQHENRGIIGALKPEGRLPRVLGEAAQTVLADPGGWVAIVTGFFIPRGEKPCPETDGPIGAAQLARFLELGGWDVSLVTDGYCEPASVRCRDLSGGGYPVIALSDPETIEDLRRSWAKAPIGQGHVISVERAGPNAKGVSINIAGDDISEVTPGLHRLFERDDMYRPHTISLADGLNEIGAANIQDALLSIRGDIDPDRICAVPVDHLILGTTANGTAAALAAAMAIAEPAHLSNLETSFDVDQSDHMLDRLSAEEIALDGVLRKFSATTVDGFKSTLLNDITQGLIRTAVTRSVSSGAE